MAREPLLLRPWLRPRDAERLRARLLQDRHLHAEADAVCPRCLRWLGEDEFVRRTAYGPLQHEVCPPPDVPSS